MWRLETGFLEGKTDAFGESVRQAVSEDLGIKSVQEVKTVEVYFLELNLTEEKVKELAEKVFLDPVIQTYSIDSPVPAQADWEIEVKLKENVTDNVGIIAVKAVEDFLGRKLGEDESIRTGKKYLIRGNLNEKQVKKICRDLLANELIESFEYGKTIAEA